MKQFGIRLASVGAALLIGLSGCASTPVSSIIEKAPSAVAKSIYPHWYLHPMANTEQQFFGYGTADSPEQAEKSALAHLLERLYVQVQSSFSQQKISETDYREYTFQSTKSDLQTQSAKLPISQYQRLNSAQINHAEFAVEVSVDKRDLVLQLENYLQEFAQDLHFEASPQPFKNWQNAHQKLKRLTNAKDTITVLSVIDPNNVVLQNTQHSIQELQKVQTKSQQDLQFLIEYPQSLDMVQSALTSKLLEQSFSIAHGFCPKCLRIELNVQSTPKQTMGFFIEDATLKLSLYSADGDLLFAQQWMEKGASSVSAEDAHRRMLSAFSEGFKDFSLLADSE